MELDYDYIAKLVRKTQEGDSDAFAELYTATYQSQYRFAYQYVKDPYLAQDILQEVYILVLKKGWVDDIIKFDGKDWQLMDPTLAASNDKESVKKYVNDKNHYVVKFNY